MPIALQKPWRRQSARIYVDEGQAIRFCPPSPDSRRYPLRPEPEENHRWGCGSVLRGGSGTTPRASFLIWLTRRPASSMNFERAPFFMPRAPRKVRKVRSVSLLRPVLGDPPPPHNLRAPLGVQVSIPGIERRIPFEVCRAARHQGRLRVTIMELAEKLSGPSSGPARRKGGKRMRSRIWIAIAGAAAVALAVVIIRRQRDRAEADRMAVWG